MVLWPTCFFMLSYQPQKLQMWLVEVGLITYLFHESFWAVFVLTFSRTLHGHCVAGFIQLNSKEHKDAKGHMAQGVSPVSSVSSLRPSTIGSSLHGGECVEGGYQGEASSVKSLHSDRWFCANVYWAKFLCKAFFSAILWVSWCYPPNY